MELLILFSTPADNTRVRKHSVRENRSGSVSDRTVSTSFPRVRRSGCIQHIAGPGDKLAAQSSNMLNTSAASCCSWRSPIIADKSCGISLTEGHSSSRTGNASQLSEVMSLSVCPIRLRECQASPTAVIRNVGIPLGLVSAPAEKSQASELFPEATDANGLMGESVDWAVCGNHNIIRSV
jgi:hypothetical protein